jgi:hypothetical protein
MHRQVHPGRLVAFSADVDTRTNTPIPTPAGLRANHGRELIGSQGEMLHPIFGKYPPALTRSGVHHFENRVILHEFARPARQECEEPCETKHHHN